jgi:uncharacterized Zn ribbon protein
MACRIVLCERVSVSSVTHVGKIRLSDEVEGVTGKIEGMKGIYIRAEFVKKA